VSEHAGLVWRLKGGAVEENKQPTTPENEDVEAHGFVDRPVGERPPMEGHGEEPDVEAHLLTGLPPAERPPAEAFTEKPVDM
jgi:hypothetical protein